MESLDSHQFVLISQYFLQLFTQSIKLQLSFLRLVFETKELSRKTLEYTNAVEYLINKWVEVTICRSPDSTYHVELVLQERKRMI